MRPHPLALRLEILAAYDAGETAQSLQARYGISVSNLRNWLSLRASTGGVEPRPHRGGAHPALDAEGRRLLAELREQNPEDGHEQLVARLADHGINVSVSTVGRRLKSLGFVRHAVKRSAKPELSKRDEKSCPRRYRRTPAPPDLPHRRAYPSDLTDAEWELIESRVPAPKPGGRRAEHSRREVVNAIFYVLRSGCQWRMLPHDFPPWETIYDYFRRWRDSGLWEELNQALREEVRQRVGRKKTPSAVIIDSQSVKTTEKGGLVDMTGRSA